MRYLVAAIAMLVLAGLVGVWFASARHRWRWFVAGGAALLMAAVLVAGVVAFPRETCELLGGNLTDYNSGPCVNEVGGRAVVMID